MRSKANALTLASWQSRAILARGILAMLFGATIFLVAEGTLAVLVLLVGTYVLFDGLIGVALGVSEFDDKDPWWPTLAGGILGLGTGGIMLLMPGAAVAALIWSVAVWAIIRGMFDVLAALRLQPKLEREWLLGLGGILSFSFGVLMFMYPRTGAAMIATFIGVYALVFGIVLTACGIRLRGSMHALVLKGFNPVAPHITRS
jgi:uncharacterized membrane protein HdeD (DUF308 family)